MSSLANARLAFIGLRCAIARFTFQALTFQMLIQAAIELARMLGRLLQLALTSRAANCRAQPLRFGVGMLRNEGGERLVVVKQPVAPCLCPVHQRHGDA